MQCSGCSVLWHPEGESNNQFPYILCVWMAIEWINCGIFQRIANNAILKQSFDWLLRSRHTHITYRTKSLESKRQNLIHTFTVRTKKRNFWFAHNGKAIFGCFIACCYRLTSGFCLRSFWFILRYSFFDSKVIVVVVESTILNISFTIINFMDCLFLRSCARLIFTFWAIRSKCDSVGRRTKFFGSNV